MSGTFRNNNGNIENLSGGTNVVDNLNSTSSTDALSAAQGKVLNDNKLDKTGASTNNTVAYTSNDNVSIFNSGNLGGQSGYAWTAVAKIATGEKHSSLFNKASTMFKNIRTIAKLIGTTDISAIGNGTLSGAISTLGSNKQDKLTNPLTKSDVVNNLTTTTTNVPLSAAQGKALKDEAVASITRSGTKFTAKNSAGTQLFTFNQLDTTTGTTYAAGSCPNNTTFGTNGSIFNLFNELTRRVELNGTTPSNGAKLVLVANKKIASKDSAYVEFYAETTFGFAIGVTWDKTGGELYYRKLEAGTWSSWNVIK